MATHHFAGTSPQTRHLIEREACFTTTSLSKRVTLRIGSIVNNHTTIEAPAAPSGSKEDL
jgi:hypothetical protein